MELHTIGMDLGKSIFHLVGLKLVGSSGMSKGFACSLQSNRSTHN